MIIGRIGIGWLGYMELIWNEIQNEAWENIWNDKIQDKVVVVFDVDLK